MKSEHRHELKQNELADWLTHLPEWTKENLSTIIGTVAVIVIVIAFFGWKAISKNVKSGEHEEFTNVMLESMDNKTQIAQQRTGDMAFMLLDGAKDLEGYSGKTGDRNIAALSLVKAGDSIRTELQYRPETVSDKVITEQINKAKKDYNDALAKKPSNKTIEGLAKFGLGLCAEELGEYAEAKEIYNDLVNNTDYEGTIIISKAQFRLEIMDSYKDDVVFQPAPEEPIPDINETLDPIIQDIREARNSDSNAPAVIDSVDANSSELEIESGLPIEISLPTEGDIPVEANSLEN